MSGSGRNRRVISSYTFGPSFDGRPRPRATLTSTWVAFPALATLGAVSVAAISLSPAVGNNSLTGVHTMNSQNRARVTISGQNAQGLQPLLQVVTATAQPIPELAAEAASPAGEHTGVRREEPPAAVTPRPARAEFIASALRVDIGQAFEVSDRSLGGTYVATPLPKLLRPAVSSEECAASCDSSGLDLNAVDEESTLYSSDRASADLQVTVQSPTSIGDAPLLKSEQLGFSALVEPQPSSNSSEDVLLASEELGGQGENSPAFGANELELTLADVVDENETSALVAPEAAPTPVEQVAGVQAMSTKVKADLRKYRNRIEARYADKPVVAAPAPNIAADVTGQIARNVAEFPVLATAGETPLGSSSAVIAEDQLVSVRLGDLISLFQDKLERPLFVWMSSSSAATRFVTPETLAAAGLDVHFDPERRQIVLGVSD